MLEINTICFSLSQLSEFTTEIAWAKLHFLSRQLSELTSVTVGATLNIMTLNITLNNEPTVGVGYCSFLSRTALLTPLAVWVEHFNCQSCTRFTTSWLLE